MEIDYIFDDFDENIFNDIKLSIYNNPTAVYYISPKSLADLMEITYKRIKLLKSICIVKYYNELKIVGYDNQKAEYNLYTLPDNFEHIMNKIGISFENITYLTIQDSIFEIIDYYQSVTTPDNIKWEFDNNNCKIYTIY
jgi:hypothetical protein